MSVESTALGTLIGKQVVLDTNSHFVYLGALKSLSEHFIELGDVDVHDGSESPTPKEIYIIDSKKYGVKKNRNSVFVRASLVVSLSLLEDVIEY